VNIAFTQGTAPDRSITRILKLHHHTHIMALLKADNGMNLVGQGPRIILFAIPAAALAVALQQTSPGVAALPLPQGPMTALGLLFITAGLALWLTAMVQLLNGFPKGKLITGGAYGVCRNPIYASYGFFVLPGISLLLGTWVYVLPAAALCLGVRLFIIREERELLRVFGAEYEEYTSRVNRIMPCRIARTDT
jgi:protein-S-isoprenylcysteine O-methyltransferase Ste14